MLRERTVIPRTRPMLRTTRYPGSSNAVVTMFSFTLTSIVPPFVLRVLTSVQNLTCASRAVQSSFVEGYAFV
jgi:hypothetical protein